MSPPPASATGGRPGLRRYEWPSSECQGRPPRQLWGAAAQWNTEPEGVRPPRSLAGPTAGQGWGGSAASPSAGPPRPGSWGKCGAGLWPGCPSRLPREIGVARRPAWLVFVAARKEGGKYKPPPACFSWGGAGTQGRRPAAVSFTSRYVSCVVTYVHVCICSLGTSSQLVLSQSTRC